MLLSGTLAPSPLGRGLLPKAQTCLARLLPPPCTTLQAPWCRRMASALGQRPLTHNPCASISAPTETASSPAPPAYADLLDVAKRAAAAGAAVRPRADRCFSHAHTLQLLSTSQTNPLSSSEHRTSPSRLIGCSGPHTQVISDNVDKPRTIEYKGTSDLVTNTDKASEEAVLKASLTLCRVSLRHAQTSHHHAIHACPLLACCEQGLVLCAHAAGGCQPRNHTLLAVPLDRTIVAWRGKLFVSDCMDAVGMQVITDAFPDHAILGEEGGVSGNTSSDYLWCACSDGIKMGRERDVISLLGSVCICRFHAHDPHEVSIENHLLCACCRAVDPLDGTTNFAHSYPCFAVSVGGATACPACPCGVS